mmetsp:Transcript_7025/g.9640  ORF Transcript_7025/g.9640 Transcript_7025/m.9640 type:complete len:82 (-) Transcript_7025:68-313(-)
MRKQQDTTSSVQYPVLKCWTENALSLAKEKRLKRKKSKQNSEYWISLATLSNLMNCNLSKLQSTQLAGCTASPRKYCIMGK